MKRLSHQLYLTIIASLLLVVFVACALWRFAPSLTPVDQAFEMTGELLAAQLPPAGASAAAQQQAIDGLYQRLRLDLALFDSERRPLAAAGQPVPPPRGRSETGGWAYGHGSPGWAIRLPDDRWIVARPPPRQHWPLLNLIGFLGGIALAVAICAYPVVRRLTGRLERLQAGVESLGAGDLSARVKVEGKDEIASLAESFNRAAARIRELVGAHKTLLANASHDLRTPLARIRMAVELMKENADPKRKAELEQDVAELDALIDEILLASRLDALKGLEADEDVDLLALAAEECARYESAELDGEPVAARGDPRLLRRMIRNLLENAKRHGAPPIKVRVSRIEGGAEITVGDRGPGVPEAECERVFDPFYRLTGAQGITGAGLGLALVRQIARQHGGEARCAPQSEQRSCFVVVLPVRSWAAGMATGVR